MTVWRFAARLGAVLVSMPMFVVLIATPVAAVPGFTVAITESPEEFTAGANASTITVVVSKSTGGERDCLKVRWSMLLKVEGIRLDQVRVDRIEEDGSFPFQIQTQSNTARLTDESLDPGTLCRGRTVTARYQMEVDESATGGSIVLTAEAYDTNLQLLASRALIRQVVTVGGEPAPSLTLPADDPSESAGATEQPEATEEPTPADQSGAVTPLPGAGGGAESAAVAATGGTGLTVVGFLVGAIMLFLGVGLLLRVRRRLQAAPEGEPGTDGVWVSSRPRRRGLFGW